MRREDVLWYRGVTWLNGGGMGLPPSCKEKYFTGKTAVAKTEVLSKENFCTGD